MLGHCPGRVRVERLLALSDALEEMRLLGFGRRVDALSSEAASELYHLPLPLRSLAEFEDIFPDARIAGSQYRSRLAGDQAWLPQAVEDFFANGGEKLWLVRVPEAEGMRGFLPEFRTPLYDTENLYGLATILVLNSVGLIALPDLERIMVAAQLPDIPRKRLANPAPVFLPCSANSDDGHRERRHSEEMITRSTPPAFVAVLQEILALIDRHRPDIQCLFSLPLEYSEVLDSPAIDRDVLTQLETARMRNSASLLRQVQLLFPYLRSPRYALRSSVGAVAGMIAGLAGSRGIWRSVAGIPLVTDGRPYPALSMTQTIALRNKPGIGIIQRRSGKVALDDERLVVPALQRNDYQPGVYAERLDDLRAGEVVRFIGFLLRQLKVLGEQLIFNIGFDDPRPRLILEKFFMDLYRQGALRGKLPEDAYSIRQASVREAVLAYDIEIAPAYPIDRIVLTFINRNGEWLSELHNA